MRFTLLFSAIFFLFAIAFAQQQPADQFIEEGKQFLK